MRRDELREAIARALRDDDDNHGGEMDYLPVDPNWDGLADAVLTVLDQEREARRAGFEVALQVLADADQRYFEAFYRSGDYSLTRRQREQWFDQREPLLNEVTVATNAVIEAAGWEVGE